MPMKKSDLLARFDGPIVMIGFGSIGKGTLPLIERHLAFDRAKFVVIAPDDRQSLGRYVVGRSDGILQVYRCVLHRYRRRAMARALYGRHALAFGTVELCP